jgi:aryl-alcohol dehydrogenase-like predicted oxidoreductase
MGSKINYFTERFSIHSMQYRFFGNTDLQVSETGFGAWAIGGNAIVGNTPIGWGRADDETSRDAIQAALEAGINFFDTADFYGLGHSEQLLGETLGSNGEVIIATKVGQRQAGNSIVADYSKEYILSACEQSLRRLKREAIDYYQLHSARMEQLQQGECIEAMELLQQQGKIRYWGLSLNTFHPFPEAEYLMEKNWGNGFQLVLNLVNQRALPLLNKAHSKGYGIIVRMPLQFGLLTGKFSASSGFSSDDHRKFRLTPPILEKSLQVLEQKVWPLAEKENISKTELALGFLLQFPEVSTVITGIRTRKHVQENARGCKRLAPGDFSFLQSLADTDWKGIMDLMETQG